MTNRQPFRSSAAAPVRAISDPIEAALALRADGRLEEALDALSGQPGQRSPDFDTLRGDVQMEMGRLDAAAESYSAVIATVPDNVYARYNLGICLFRLERWEDAAAALQEVLDYDPHRDQVRIYLGGCLLHLNRFEEALECFDRCWSEAARHAALFGKGVALHMLRQFDEAEAVYKHVSEAEPNAEEALSNLIAMSMEVFDLGRVHRYSQQLLERAPQSRIALQGLTLVAIERQDYETAAAYFSRLPTPPPGTDGEENDAIEYRLSQEVLERLNETRPRLSAGMRARPNGVRDRF